MIWGWLRALIEGIVAPLIAAWQQKEHGRTAQRLDDAAATVAKEREITDALDAVRDDPVRLDIYWLRRKSGGDAPAGDDPKPAPRDPE